MRALHIALTLLAAVALSACEPRPPKPKTYAVISPPVAPYTIPVT